MGVFFIAWYFTTRRQQLPSYIDRLEASKQMQERMKQSGVSAGFTYLRGLISEQRLRGSDCHILVHDIGHFAFESYGSFSQAMQHSDELCNSGYIHGLLERGFQEGDQFMAEAPSVCATVPKGLKTWECYHGIGHGFMYETSNDLPKSIELCEKLDAEGSGPCVNGVFMENFNSEDSLHPSAYRSSEHPLRVCQDMSDQYKGDCYVYAPAYYLAEHPDDIEGALLMCAESEISYRSTCWLGIGAEIMKQHVPDIRSVEQLCARTGSNERPYCFLGATVYYSLHTGIEGAAACDMYSPKIRTWCHSWNIES